MTCPACNAHTSSVRIAYLDDQPCPQCNLPAATAEAILDIRARQADAELTRRYEEALIRAGRAEAELARLRIQFDAIRGVLDD